MERISPTAPRKGGRRKGTRNKLKVRFVEPRKLTHLGSNPRTPLAVMLDTMHFFDKMAQEHILNREYEIAANYLTSAVHVAEKAAPYMHPRLVAVADRSEQGDRFPVFVLRAPPSAPSAADWEERWNWKIIETEVEQDPRKKNGG